MTNRSIDISDRLSTVPFDLVLFERLRKVATSRQLTHLSWSKPIMEKEVNVGESGGDNLTTAPLAPLVADTIPKLKAVVLFKEHVQPVTSMGFAPSGNLLVTSGQDDQIVVYESENT